MLNYIPYQPHLLILLNKFSSSLVNGGTLGAIVDIPYPEACIGCMACELSCPDFAIFVADKSEFKFAKLNDESKQRAEAIRANNNRIPDDYKKDSKRSGNA